MAATPPKSPPTVTSNRVERIITALANELENASTHHTDEMLAHTDGKQTEYYRAHSRVESAVAWVRSQLRMIGNGHFDEVERALGTRYGYEYED